MTSFKILKGLEEKLPGQLVEGKMYFCTDTGNLYVDCINEQNVLERKLVNKDSLDNIQEQLDSHSLNKSEDNILENPTTLNFGDTFTAITDTTVDGHTITDNITTYTLPNDRLFTTLVPTGTEIATTGTDLKSITYLKVGRYYCPANATAKTLKNCPTDFAFMMEVYSPLSTTIDNETTAKYVYRLRKITEFHTGMQYIQYVGSGETPGAFTYDDWYVVPRAKFALDSSDKNDGGAAVGSATKPVYIDSDGTITACTYTLGKSVPSDAKFTDTNTTYERATTTVDGLMSFDDKIKIDYTNVAYGTCSTAAATAAKVVTLSGNANWTLTTGSIITVLFSNTNTASNPTLNVNNTGAKSIYYGSSAITTSSLDRAGAASRLITYIYDGTQYRFASWGTDNNSDEKVKQAASTTNGSFPVLLRGTSAGTSTTTTTTSFGTGITANPSTNTLSATAFTGNRVTINNSGTGTNGLTIREATGDEESIRLNVTSTYGAITNTNETNKGELRFIMNNLDESNDGAGANANAVVIKGDATGTEVTATKFTGTLNGPIGTSTEGSTTNPIYIKDGVPTAISYEIKTSVPENAVFTDTTYGRATTAADGLMPSEDKAKVDYTNVAYGTCTTAAATAAKIVTIVGNDNWALMPGSMVSVTFEATNTASNPTINVNGTGAKSVSYRDAIITTENLGFAGYANAVLTFMYDGTNYVFVSRGYDSNSDTKVTQSKAITTAGEYPVILGYSTSTSSVTNTVNKTSTLKYNPSTKILTAPTFKGDLTGNADTATLATSATKADQDRNGKVIDEIYETKDDASAKLAEAKEYANGIKNDLLNGAGDAYDTLSELGVLIDNNKGAIDALREIATGKADANHTHKYAGSSSVGGAANTVAVTDNDVEGNVPTTGTVYYIPYTTGKSGSQTLRANKDLYYYDTGSTSDLCVGSTSQLGGLTLQAGNGKYTHIVPTSTTSASRTFTLPDVNGTIITTGNLPTPADIGAAASSHTHAISNITNLQTSLDAKQATITGAATTITGSNLTASRALISNSSGKVAVSAVTSTELGYLDGVTSAIQTQLNNRVTLDTAQTITGIKTFNAPANVDKTEQITAKFKTSNGGSIIFGKEGPNSGTMIRLDQTDGTPRLRFRSSATAGAMVWEQPEANAALYIDLGNSAGTGVNRISFPQNKGGTVAMTSDVNTRVDKAGDTMTGNLTAPKLFASQGLAITQTDGTAGYGISLYGSTSPQTYGLWFGKTATYGTHGSVTSDWATYFGMNSGATTRGWVFRREDGCVASISGAGNLTLNGSAKIGNAVTMAYDSSNECLNFTF